MKLPEGAQEWALDYRKYGYRFVYLDKVPPDFLMEFLMRRRVFELQVGEPIPTTDDPISRDVRDKIIVTRMDI